MIFTLTLGGVAGIGVVSVVNRMNNKVSGRKYSACLQETYRDVIYPLGATHATVKKQAINTIRLLEYHFPR